MTQPTLDRRALVTRHQPVVTCFDPWSPLTVGNGEFAFTVDATGLQTFPEFYKLPGIPLGTYAQWAWHSTPNPADYQLAETFVDFPTHGRQVGYPMVAKTGRQAQAADWLRRNPHRLHLGRIGLRFAHKITAQDFSGIQQTLDLWSGRILSRFLVRDKLMEVETCCHPTRDLLAIRIKSQWLRHNAAWLNMEFPYGSSEADPDEEDEINTFELHRSCYRIPDAGPWLIERRLDQTSYCVTLHPSANVVGAQIGAHRLAVASNAGDELDLTVEFSPHPVRDDPTSFPAVRQAAAEHWERFWSTGGAVDLSASTDRRAGELERRVVLSQYLTAVQCAGTMPPQESGLTFNSWHGKSHLEMHWWHGVHFAQWDRLPLLERSLCWYERILPLAQTTARRQGFPGARWPKMVGPDGRESPSPIGPFLLWQQPHPIYYAELCYRAKPHVSTLERYINLVDQTAQFMAAVAEWDEASDLYSLGPPLIAAQERFDPATTRNTPFELAYWHWGLSTAQLWRERLKLKPDAQWEHVLKHLPPLPQANGFYLAGETAPDSYTRKEMMSDHPAVLLAYGMLPPSPLVEKEVMLRTLMKIISDWNWSCTWGWDFPLVAMAAARLGEPGMAINALMMRAAKNTFLPNGHNRQRHNLPIYLPGNGSLLTAVAMMAAGWDGGPDRHAPGFPDNGQWSVQYENLRKMI